MKRIRSLFLFLIVALLTTNSLAQKAPSDKILRHSYLEYEQSLTEMKGAIKQANDTYAKAQETYEVSEKYMEKGMKTYDDFYNFIRTLTGIIALLISIGVYSYIKKTKNYYKKQYESVFEKIKKQQDDIVRRLVETEKWGDDLRKESRLVVLNIKGTSIQADFSKVVNFFKESIFIEIDSFDVDQIVTRLKNLKLGNLGVVIIEDSDGKLKPDPRNVNKKDINDKMVELANIICSKNGLFYYGSGSFPIENITEQSKKNMISFANAPAQLYGNLMNLLKFRSIVQKSN